MSEFNIFKNEKIVFTLADAIKFKNDLGYDYSSQIDGILRCHKNEELFSAMLSTDTIEFFQNMKKYATKFDFEDSKEGIVEFFQSIQ